QGSSGDVAGGHYQREPERDLAAVVRKNSAKIELDRRSFARHQVAHSQVENAGPVLFGNGRAVAVGDRLVVLLACLAALFQDAAQDSAGNLHAEAGNGRTIWQRKDICGLEGFIERVHECLAYGDTRQQAVDATDDIQRLQG